MGKLDWRGKLAISLFSLGVLIVGVKSHTRLATIHGGAETSASVENETRALTDEEYSELMKTTREQTRLDEVHNEREKSQDRQARAIVSSSSSSDILRPPPTSEKNPATAWVASGWVSEDGNKLYIADPDLASMASKGVLGVWIMVDFRNIEAGKYRSFSAFQHVDCRLKTGAKTSVRFFAGNLAEGESMTGFDDPRRLITPNGIDEFIYKEYCK